MIRDLRPALAGLLLVPILLGCGKPSGTSTATPADVYAAAPSQADVRKLFGDSNWYEGPPSFGVLPLDQGRMSLNIKFMLTVSYEHLGSGEDLLVAYSMFATTAAATTAMTNLKTAFSGEATTPKVGDDTLYHGESGSGAAPFVSHTFVRSGQVLVEMILSRKDSQASVNDLARYAKKFIGGLQNLAKAKSHASPSPVDAKQLPPPGRDITLLGSARLPIEAFVVMTSVVIPDNARAILGKWGVSAFTYGDYALNADTHMEVQTAFVELDNAVDAQDWAALFGSDGGTIQPDSKGLYSAYLPAIGEYHYVIAEDHYGIFVICKAAVAGEAASRACDDPMSTTLSSWALALRGLG